VKNTDRVHLQESGQFEYEYGGDCKRTGGEKLASLRAEKAFARERTASPFISAMLHLQEGDRKMVDALWRVTGRGAWR
jgi:hypothetical protein